MELLAHRAMTARSLMPRHWRSLPRHEQIEMMAYEQRRSEWRMALVHEVIQKAPPEISALAQILIHLAEF